MIFANKPMNREILNKVKILYREVRGSRFKVQGSRFKVQGSRFKVRGSRFEVQESKNMRLTLQVFFVPIRGSLPRAGVRC